MRRLFLKRMDHLQLVPKLHRIDHPKGIAPERQRNLKHPRPEAFHRLGDSRHATFGGNAQSVDHYLPRAIGKRLKRFSRRREPGYRPRWSHSLLPILLRMLADLPTTVKWIANRISFASHARTLTHLRCCFATPHGRRWLFFMLATMEILNNRETRWGRNLRGRSFTIWCGSFQATCRMSGLKTSASARHAACSGHVENAASDPAPPATLATLATDQRLRQATVARVATTSIVEIESWTVTPTGPAAPD